MTVLRWGCISTALLCWCPNRTAGKRGPLSASGIQVTSSVSRRAAPRNVRKKHAGLYQYSPPSRAPNRASGTNNDETRATSPFHYTIHFEPSQQRRTPRCGKSPSELYQYSPPRASDTGSFAEFQQGATFSIKTGNRPSPIGVTRDLCRAVLIQPSSRSPTEPAFRHRATFSLHIAVHQAATLQNVSGLPSRERLYCYSRFPKTLVGQQEAQGRAGARPPRRPSQQTSPRRPCPLRVHGKRVHAFDNHSIIPIPVHSRERTPPTTKLRVTTRRKKNKKKSHARSAGRSFTFSTYHTVVRRNC